MSSWHDVLLAAPDLAERAQRILSSTTNNVLGTLRADGSPRLSGIDPIWFEGDLWLGSMPDSRKGADLRRDPRMALHSIPWESRKPKAEDPGAGDAKLSGRAVLLSPEEFAQVAPRLSGDLDPAPPPGPYDLFRVDVEALAVIWVEDDRLVIDRWAAEGGRVRVDRG